MNQYSGFTPQRYVEICGWNKRIVGIAQMAASLIVLIIDNQSHFQLSEFFLSMATYEEIKQEPSYDSSMSYLFE